MFRRAASAASSSAAPVCRRAFSAAARVPSIKFSHGARAAIDAQMARQAATPAPHFTVFPAAGSCSVKCAGPAGTYNAAPVVKGTVTAGGYTTTTIVMGGDFFGNPFGRGSGMAWEDATIALVEAGGAFDAPAPAKGKGGKGGKPAKK